MKATKTPVICDKCGAETHYPITVIEMVYAGELITNTVCGACETEMVDGGDEEQRDHDGYLN